MKKLNSYDWIALVLVIIGAVNWGFLGLLNLNLVSTIFGNASLLSRIVYDLVGLAGIYLIFAVGMFVKKGNIK